MNTKKYYCKKCKWTGDESELGKDSVETCFGDDDLETCPKCGSTEVYIDNR